MLKKLAFLFLIIIIGSTGLNAQHEVKINALGLFYGNYGGAYEYGFAKKFGGNISASFYSTPVFLKKILDLGYKSKGINAELRYYAGKNTNSSGFFIGPYVKYIKRKYSGIPFVEASDFVQVNITDININKIALGLVTGYKGIILNNLVLGGYLGLGYNIYSNRTFTNPEITEKQKDSLPQGLTTVNFRIGINVGYRFVQYNESRYY